MKSFHLICAKCGSMDIIFQYEKDKNDLNNPDTNYAYTRCNNCIEVTDVEQHNTYIEEMYQKHLQRP
jgi:hypothetical protein